MKTLLWAALFCSILLSVCGQENDQWKRMKAGSRSFRNGNTNSVYNTESEQRQTTNVPEASERLRWHSRRRSKWKQRQWPMTACEKPNFADQKSRELNTSALNWTFPSHFRTYLKNSNFSPLPHR